MSTFDPNLLSDLILATLKESSGISLQRQIYKVVQQAILDARLAPGHRLPATRALAKELKVSRMTVTLAYDKLGAEGYIVSTHGSGSFVANIHPAVSRAQMATQLSAPDDRPGLSRRAVELVGGTHGATEHEGAFVPGVADTTNFPFHIWQRMQNRYAKKPFSALTGYSSDGGYLPLRQALAEYLQISRSVKCSPHQILITMGTNQSLDLCAHMLADTGDVALIEEPCNWSTALIWKAASLRVVPVPIDEDGVAAQLFPFQKTKPEDLPKLLFTTPSHQYPMGGSMGLHRRRLLIELAREHNFWIIEDDYDSEFRYDSSPLPSLQGLDEHERVIYLGTFSKVMYPGLRMSYLVVPEALADAFASGLTQLYRPGQLGLQAAMADFIGEGYFATHIRRMRGIYAERQRELKRALNEHFGDTITVSTGHTGLHLTIQFTSNIDLAKMTAEARTRGIYLRDISLYHQLPHSIKGYVLGYGGVRTNDIEPAVKKMAEAYLVAKKSNRQAC